MIRNIFASSILIAGMISQNNFSSSIKKMDSYSVYANISSGLSVLTLKEESVKMSYMALV